MEKVFEDAKEFLAKDGEECYKWYQEHTEGDIDFETFDEEFDEVRSEHNEKIFLFLKDILKVSKQRPLEENEIEVVASLIGSAEEYAYAEKDNEGIYEGVDFNYEKDDDNYEDEYDNYEEDENVAFLNDFVNSDSSDEMCLPRARGIDYIGIEIETNQINQGKPFGALYKALNHFSVAKDLHDKRHQQMGDRICELVEEDNFEGLKYLKENQIDINEETFLYLYPLHNKNPFRRAQSVDMVAFLQDAGCHINVRHEGNFGVSSVLCHAIEERRPIGVVKRMITAGANIDRDFKKALRECLKEAKENKSSKSKNFYDNPAEIEAFLRQIDPKSYIHERKNELIDLIYKRHKGGAKTLVSGLSVNEELAKMHDTIGTITPEKAKALSPAIKKAILAKRKREK